MRRVLFLFAKPQWAIGAILALLVLPAVALADEPIAEIENRGNALVFYPTIEGYERLMLTVTGPCEYLFQRSFGPEKTPFFRLDDRTIDGNYSYSLVAMPTIDREVIQILQKARAKGNDQAAKKLCREGRLPGAPLNQAEGFTVSQREIIFEPGSFEKRFDGEGGGNLDHLLKGGAGATLDPLLKDFVINDDLIVDGSACIGFDCVNGESFGFDTIRLKENNLRIKFDDTSVAASFPRNDWQLTANDSANGGASKFSIDDISGNRTPFTVEANARSHSLYVDDGGRIGSRTSTPSVEIHTIDGDTPTLRLQQDGSSGFAPQTWDVAGNETNFFIRDVTNGSALPFRIRPGAPSSAIFIDVSGDVGVGTASPDEPMHVLRTDANRTTVLVENSNAAAQNADVILKNTAAEWAFRNNTAGDFLLQETADGTVEFQVDADGNLTIQGNLVTGGGGTCDPGPCDGTFTDYEVESIEEHAEYMWSKAHLWGVGPTPEGAPLNLSRKTTGILHELEKAHIYIEQLNNELKSRSDEIESLNERLEALETMLQR